MLDLTVRNMCDSRSGRRRDFRTHVAVGQRIELRKTRVHVPPKDSGVAIGPENVDMRFTCVKSDRDVWRATVSSNSNRHNAVGPSVPRCRPVFSREVIRGFKPGQRDRSYRPENLSRPVRVAAAPRTGNYPVIGRRNNWTESTELVAAQRVRSTPETPVSGGGSGIMCQASTLSHVRRRWTRASFGETLR